jgi:hypothetical protein
MHSHQSVARRPFSGARFQEYISRRIYTDGWGKNTVVALANFICRHQPGARGSSAQNLRRMHQFYET